VATLGERASEQPAPASAPEIGDAARDDAVLDAETVASEPRTSALEHEINSGDTLAKIFSDSGLSANLLHRIVHSSPEAKKLARIKPGQHLRILLDEQGEFQRLEYRPDPVRTTSITATADGFVTQVHEKKVEHRIARSSGTISRSLFEDAQEAGLADSLTMELAKLFGWDIDFALEIREGDSFSLIYQELYLEGEKLRDGAILAAEFVNQGKVFRALRYEDAEGNEEYYTPEGKSVRRSFLRTPVNFSRISSRFSLGRRHPILNKIRSHKGVDYAAPSGTPVRAAGNGNISFRGRKGGYGKTVIINHGDGRTTLYAHLSRYAAKKGKGTRVKQGQVIGYVGQTGLATGPHLHYEFRINGKHRNPLSVTLPPAKPIAKKYAADFQEKSRPLMAQLDLLRETQVAALSKARTKQPGG